MMTTTVPAPYSKIDPDKIMKYISLAILCAGIIALFSSCRPQRTLVESRSCSHVSERLTPHALPADTADLSFRIIESGHRLTIAEPRISAPPNTDTHLAIDSDRVSVSLIRGHDTIYLPSREIIRTDTVYIRPDPTPPKHPRPSFYNTLKMLSTTLFLTILLLLTFRFVTPQLPKIRKLWQR